MKNHSLNQLLMQMRFTPLPKRSKQLALAIELIEEIENERMYPFEFIFFKITGFRPKTPVHLEPIKGELLAEDLQIFIEKLSSQLKLDARQYHEPVFSIESLAENMKVSTKTIHRWRKKGLIALRFRFPDGVIKLGFPASHVDKFVNKYPGLTKNAQLFTRMSDDQKELIIKKAQQLALNTHLSRHQIIKRIAQDTGKAHETIRLTITKYEKNLADRKTFFRPLKPKITAEKAKEIYRLYESGKTIDQLTQKFSRSRSSMYRIINKRRIKEILKNPLDFVPSEEFYQPDAMQQILSSPKNFNIQSRLDKVEQINKEHVSANAAKSELSLTREEELGLFKRYNFLKFLVTRKKEELKDPKVNSDKIKKVESWLEQAEKIKNLLIECNLPLVLSIAGRHMKSVSNFTDLVSDGNIAMMRAIEKFDYSKGFRFNTYASLAIAKEFARKIPAEENRLDKASAASVDNIGRDMRTAEIIGVAAVEQARKSLVQVIRENLDEREQYIIINHFGLLGTLIRKQKKTFKEIGTELNLSKERVRQIELTALQKLRHSLSIEQFELLTG